MRDRVKVILGSKEYSLLPAIGVLEAFEDRFGSIGAHVQRLSAEAGIFNERAWLILKALSADSENTQTAGGRAMPWDLDAVKAAMFETGLYSLPLVKAEIELIERLIYTPEQYAEKKTARAALEADQATVMAGLSSFTQ